MIPDWPSLISQRDTYPTAQRCSAWHTENHNSTVLPGRGKSFALLWEALMAQPRDYRQVACQKLVCLISRYVNIFSAFLFFYFDSDDVGGLLIWCPFASLECFQ